MSCYNISLVNYSNINTTGFGGRKNSGLPTIDVEYLSIKRTVFVLLVVLGISFNIFVIVLAMKYTVRKNLHHLIINMAVSDSLFLFSMLLSCIPWMSDYKWSIFPSTIFGLITCKIIMFLQETSYMVSLVTLLIISVERFRATRRTLQRPRPYTLTKRCAAIAVSWIIPLLSAVFSMYFAQTLGGDCGIIVREYKNYERIAGALLALLYGVFAGVFALVSFVLSIVTIRRLSQPQAIQAHLNKQQRQVRTRRSKAAVRMVLVSVLLYMVTWLPFFVCNWFHFARIITSLIGVDYSSMGMGCYFSSSVYVIYYFLPSVNSCFSPCFYIIFLANFREAAKKVLCRRRETPNQPPNRRRSYVCFIPMVNTLIGPKIEEEGEILMKWPRKYELRDS